MIIQTYAPHHYSIRAARDQDYARFMRRELELRRELMYPPFAKLAMVRIEGADAEAVSRIATSAAHALARAADAYRRTASPDRHPRARTRARADRANQAALSMAGDGEVARISPRCAPRSPRCRRRLRARARESDVYLGIDIDPVRML